MLSDELREALGGVDEAELVVESKRSKKRGREQDKANVPSELVERHMYHSSKEKRRLEQITKRKEKEARRGEFLAVLKDNEILPEHRDLLISGKELGQMHTVKNRLKMVLKRYKAGLTLTDAERELLFPNGERIAELDEIEVPPTGTASGLGQGPDLADGGGEGTLIDLFAVCAPQSNGSDASGSSSSSKIKTKGTGKAKKSSDGEVSTQVSEPKVAPESQSATQPLAKTPALSKADVASTARSLVAQLQLLKSTLKASTSTSAVDKGEDKSEIPQSVGEAEVTLRKYIPVPLVLPHCFDHAMPLVPIPAAAGSTPAAAIAASTTSFMTVERPPGVQEARLALPVCGMEQEVVEAILQHDTVIVCGETGSGKSTQVPQFCYENGFAREGLLIGVTQPRRVAAVTTADRVSFEMGDGTRPPSSRLVGYQIRHDNSTGASTAIKFMTDGILLQELEQDLLLRRYSVVLIDEAHERGVNSDVLLGLLSRAVPLRRQRHEQESALYARLSPEERTQFLPPLPPLKLVIMSATLRVEDFGSPRLFPGGAPPVVRVETRQFPVTVHFSRTTQTSHHRGAYLDDAVKKVRQIHSRLPPGGILVFLTGKREIAYAVKRLRRALSGHGSNRGRSGVEGGGEVDEEGKERGETSAVSAQEEGEWGFGEEGGSDSDSDSEGSLSGPENDDKDIDEADYDADVTEEVGADKSTTVSAAFVNLPAAVFPAASSGNAETDIAAELRSRMLQEAVLAGPEGTNNSAPDSVAPDATQAAAQTQTPPRLRIVPLYAMLSAMQQREAFRPVDAALERLVVVATNVAETSITIPGIRYVVDAGREKRRVLLSSGPEQGGARVVSRFEVGWVSQASAEQRKGRAGRTGPGHCYRLYSAAFFDAHMVAFSEPQIRTVPLESLVLKMKAIGIRDILAFPFPTPPPAHAMRQAVQALQNIGAVVPEGQGQGQGQQQLTLLGKRISKFALPPRLAKVLVWATTHCRAAREALADATSVLSKDEDNGVGGTDAKRARMKRERESSRESERVYLSARELLEHVLGLVSVLADKSPFLRLGGRLQDGEGDEDGDAEGGDSTRAGAGDKDRRQEREKQLLWVHRDGDALARFRAFGAYCYYRGRDLGEGGSKSKGNGRGADVGTETAREIAAFCATHSLSEQALARAFSMRQQLARQLALDSGLALSDSEGARAGPGTTKLERLDRAALESAAGPPSSAVETALLQLLLSAHGDQLARRAPLGAVSLGSRRQRLTAYLCTNPEVREPLYLHPHSCLYSSDPAAPLPEWVVFDGLVRNEAHTTTYMECASVVNPGWAAEALEDCPLLQFGPLLETPMPFFDRAMDCVLGYSLPAIGAHKWSLAPVQLPLSHPAFSSASADAQQAGSVGGVPGLRACDLEYRWFARLLLEGRVPLSLSVSLQGVLGRDALCDAPSALTSGKPIPKVINLLRVLIDKRCTSSARLLGLLHSSASSSANSKYLQEELAAFVALDKKKDFRRLWTKL